MLFSVYHRVDRAAQGEGIKMQQFHSESGQAIIEFVVGLVGLLVLIAAILQMGYLSFEHNQTMLEAREKTGRLSIGATYGSGDGLPEAIYDWNAGNDEQRYTRDDYPTTMRTPSEHFQEISQYAHPEELQSLVGTSALNHITSSNTYTAALGLCTAKERSNSTPLFPIIRQLVYNNDHIEVETETAMTWIGGL